MLVVVVWKPYFWGPILFCSGEILGAQRSVRVLDTKPGGGGGGGGGGGVAGSSITRVTALCPWARSIN